VSGGYGISASPGEPEEQAKKGDRMNSARPATRDDPADERPDPTHRASESSGVKAPETTPAEERGERLDTGKIIAHGGQD
jgi:hypothetical protein